MSRKVYFTQEQLKHIMGEDIINGGGYLDKTSTGSEYPTDSLPATDSEVIMTDPGGISRTTDAYSNQKIRNNQWLRRGTGYSLYENDKKKAVKQLNERNAELDGKAIYSLPKKIRQYAVPDGIHDEIMERLRSGEKMTIASLYRLRNELQNSENTTIKQAIDTLIKQAQVQGASLRNASQQAGLKQIRKPGFITKKQGNTTIYYEKN